MRYSINFFGSQLECDLVVSNDNILIHIPENEQAQLQAYLLRVLTRYEAISPEETHLSLTEIVKRAIEVEKNISGHMSEPTVKLPYEFMPDVKQKLIDAASKQGISATKLLIRLIEDKHSQEFNL